MPASTGSIGIGMPMRPVEHTSTSLRHAAERLGGELAHPPRVAPAGLARRGVGVAGVEHDRGGAPVAQVRAAHLHRGGGDEVGREHPGRGDRRRSAVATIARSGAPDALIPHASPPATNPCAAVTLIARSRCFAPGRSGPGSLRRRDLRGGRSPHGISFTA